MSAATTAPEIACPDWCTRDPHVEVVMPDDRPWHYRTIGAVGVQTDGRECEVDVDALEWAGQGWADTHAVAGLRQLAADALAAAAWIEEQAASTGAPAERLRAAVEGAGFALTATGEGAFESLSADQVVVLAEQILEQVRKSRSEDER